MNILQLLTIAVNAYIDYLLILIFWDAIVRINEYLRAGKKKGS